MIQFYLTQYDQVISMKKTDLLSSSRCPRRRPLGPWWWLSLIFFGLLLIGPAEPGTGKPMVNLTIGYLPTILGEHRDKQGLSISGAITYALKQIEKRGILPDGVSLVLQFNDTRSDLLLTTKALTEMMCKDVVAVFGPENTCNVEATISSAWNRMMISHVSLDLIRLTLFTFVILSPFVGFFLISRNVQITPSRTRRNSRRLSGHTRPRHRLI
jgi:hypothetical protein